MQKASRLYYAAVTLVAMLTSACTTSARVDNRADSDTGSIKYIGAEQAERWIRVSEFGGALEPDEKIELDLPGLAGATKLIINLAAPTPPGEPEANLMDLGVAVCTENEYAEYQRTGSAPTACDVSGRFFPLGAALKVVDFDAATPPVKVIVQNIGKNSGDATIIAFRAAPFLGSVYDAKFRAFDNLLRRKLRGVELEWVVNACDDVLPNTDSSGLSLKAEYEADAVTICSDRLDDQFAGLNDDEDGFVGLFMHELAHILMYRLEMPGYLNERYVDTVGALLTFLLADDYRNELSRTHAYWMRYHRRHYREVRDAYYFPQDPRTNYPKTAAHLQPIERAMVHNDMRVSRGKYELHFWLPRLALILSDAALYEIILRLRDREDRVGDSRDKEFGETTLLCETIAERGLPPPADCG